MSNDSMPRAIPPHPAKKSAKVFPKMILMHTRISSTTIHALYQKIPSRRRNRRGLFGDTPRVPCRDGAGRAALLRDRCGRYGRAQGRERGGGSQERRSMRARMRPTAANTHPAITSARVPGSSAASAGVTNKSFVQSMHTLYHKRRARAGGCAAATISSSTGLR